VSGVVVIGTLMAATGYAAWAAQLAQNTDPATAPSPTAARTAAVPPPGLLTPLEEGRHQLFLKWIQGGDIKVVFLGDSMTDFWHYDDNRGGKTEWDRRYVPLKAINFGVEGAHTRSVLWRLQHGELDGYEAKVFVLTALGIADVFNHGLSVDDAIAGNAAIVAEIRKRQPGAKILINSIPRGPRSTDRESIIERIAAGAAKLADGRAVFYEDIAGRFIQADGTLDGELTGLSGGTLTPKGYAVWGEAIDPVLQRLLRL
jgi:beta-glucosidase